MKKLLFILLLPALGFAQVDNWRGKTVEELSAIEAGVTNIASKLYWETYAYQQIKDLVDEYYDLTTFTAQDATPSITGGKYFLTANTSAKTITDFDDHPTGSYRKVIWIHVNDDYTTIDHNSNLDCGGVDLAPTTGDILRLYWNGSKWHCSFAYIE